jgi:hypothetical protein
MLKNDGTPVAEPKHPFALYPAFEPSLRLDRLRHRSMTKADSGNVPWSSSN